MEWEKSRSLPFLACAKQCVHEQFANPCVFATFVLTTPSKKHMVGEDLISCDVGCHCPFVGPPFARCSFLHSNVGVELGKDENIEHVAL